MTAGENQIHLTELREAIARKDPSFDDLFFRFLQQPDLADESELPDEYIYFHSLRYETLWSYQMRSLPPGDARKEYRDKKWAEYLEQEGPLPERLKLGDVLLELYESKEEWGREVLLRLIPRVPFRWGPWRGLKQIFKMAEATHDVEVLGAIAARIDVEFAENPARPREDVTNNTLLYLRRRAWRYLRRLGQTMPALYPHAVVHFLRWYPDWRADWSGKSKLIKLWILNHIFYHNHTKKSNNKKRVPRYGYSQFKYGTYYNEMPEKVSQHCAYPDLWKVSAEPLFDLLLLGRADRVTQFAVELLQKHFKTELRELPLEFLIRMGQRPFAAVQRFVKELIEENPAWQKAQFKELGLHDLMLDHFLYSSDSDVRKYAVTYARDYAADMPFEKLLEMLKSGEYELKEFALQLIGNRDARKELGLDAIQQLFLISDALDLAKKLLKKGFSPSEIPLDWFKPILFCNEYSVIQFAVEYLKKDFPAKELTAAWFQSLLQDPRLSNMYYDYLVRDFAMENLAKMAPKLDADWVKQALLHDTFRYSIEEWASEGKLSPKQLDLDWMRLLLDPEAWRESEWVTSCKKDPNAWITDLTYPEDLKYFATQYLGNTKRFSPEDLGLEWLLGLLQSDDYTSTSFAREYLLRHFNPYHFARAQDLEGEAEEAAEVAEPAENPFEGKSFLFTGKLRSLTRKEASAKVEAIDGVNAKSVTKTLDYLVIGDEGSPLFGEGKKGSKLVKAEKLQESGSEVQIISETDWLRMISEGSAAKVDADPRALASGFKHLFELATTADKHPNTRDFALSYLQERHPVLGPELSGHPLEGEQVLPRSYYKGALFLPLLESEEEDLQRFAIKIARFDLRRWDVAPDDIFKLCESPHTPVRRFALESLLGPTDKDTTEEFYFRPEELNPDLVFALTESRRRAVRQAGIALIHKHYDLLNGDTYILRLAESPDRDVRTQAVKLLWKRYHSPATTLSWSPSQDQRATIQPSPQAMKDLESTDMLVQFVRTVLFGIPPGRLEKRPRHAPKPLSNSKAKVHMIELLRDLAMQDAGFATHIKPLLQTFLASEHSSESLTCLVALTQIQHHWDQQAVAN